MLPIQPRVVDVMFAPALAVSALITMPIAFCTMDAMAVSVEVVVISMEAAPASVAAFPRTLPRKSVLVLLKIVATGELVLTERPATAVDPAATVAEFVAVAAKVTTARGDAMRAPVEKVAEVRTGVAAFRPISAAGDAATSVAAE